MKQWSDLADPCTLDPGFSVYMTRQKCERLACGFDGEGVDFVLQAPEDVQFFSFTRYAQAVSTLIDLPPKWLYTVFGYALDQQVILVRLSVPDKVLGTPEIECLYLPRPVSFPW